MSLQEISHFLLLSCWCYIDSFVTSFLLLFLSSLQALFYLAKRLIHMNSLLSRHQGTPEYNIIFQISELRRLWPNGHAIAWYCIYQETEMILTLLKILFLGLSYILMLFICWQKCCNLSTMVTRVYAVEL